MFASFFFYFLFFFFQIGNSPSAYRGPVPSVLKDNQTVADYRNHYAVKELHKAFAFSESGPYGYCFEKKSVEEAKTCAMAFCDKYRKPEHKPCFILNADDWTVRSALETKNHLKSSPVMPFMLFNAGLIFAFMGIFLRKRAIQAPLSNPNTETNNDTVAPQNLEKKLQTKYVTTAIVCSSFLIAQGLYAFLAHIMKLSAKSPLNPAFRNGIFSISAGCLLLSLLLKDRLRNKISSNPSGEAFETRLPRLSEKLLRNILIGMALAEAPAVFGLLLYIETGYLKDFYILAIPSFLVTLLNFPFYPQWKQSITGGEQ